MVDARDMRQEERIRAELPVYLDNAIGTTTNVSASGLFFETSASLAEGESIDFSVEFDTPSGKRLLRCRGEIVRAEVRDHRVGVAVRIQDSTMEVGSGQRKSEVASVASGQN